MARPIEWMGNGRPLPQSQYPPTTPFAAQTGVVESFDDPNEIGQTGQLPALNSPPSYATTDLRTAPSYDAGRGNAQTPSTLAWDIYRASPNPGLCISHAGEEGPVYYIGRYSAPDTPDVILYQGADSHGPILAQAKVSTAASPKDMQVYVGDSAVPNWQAVSCVSEGRVFHSDSYHFTAPSVEPDKTRLFAWKPTHDTHLGSGKFRS
jgi:hypothetical protein